MLGEVIGELRRETGVRSLGKLRSWVFLCSLGMLRNGASGEGGHIDLCVCTISKEKKSSSLPLALLLPKLLFYPVLSILGTPTESSWPNVTDLDDWNVGFPKWPRIGLTREYEDLGEIGINMLEVQQL